MTKLVCALFYDPNRRAVTRLPSQGSRSYQNQCSQSSVSDPAAEARLFKIGVIPGDGVGPEVIAEGLAILGDVAQLEGFEYTLDRFDLGGERFLATGEVLPEAVIEKLRGCDVILLGAVGHPAVAPGILEKGILLRLRFEFHQYINLRPVHLYPGVETPIRGKGPEDIDMVVVRENNEDLYVGAGGFTRKGTAEEVAIQTSINTRAGVDRALRFALEQARARARQGPFRGLTQCGDRSRPDAPGDLGRQDQRPDLRPRPLDAGLHGNRT